MKLKSEASTTLHGTATGRVSHRQANARGASPHFKDATHQHYKGGYYKLLGVVEFLRLNSPPRMLHHECEAMDVSENVPEGIYYRVLLGDDNRLYLLPRPELFEYPLKRFALYRDALGQTFIRVFEEFKEFIAPEGRTETVARFTVLPGVKVPYAV